MKRQLKYGSAGLCLSVVLTACGGGSSGSPDSQSPDVDLSNPDGGSTTLRQRMTTGIDASDTDSQWSCSYPNAGNTTTAFQFWADGNGRNIDGDGATVNFTWTADEANNAVSATIPDLGVGGLNSIVFQSDDRFTAFDTINDEVIACERGEGETQDAETGGMDLELALSNGADASSQSTFWNCGIVSYAFLDDGNAILSDETGDSPLTWEVNEANSIVASGFSGFVLQNVSFPNADEFTAVDFLSGDTRNCTRQALNRDEERLITGSSLVDIGNQSWECDLDSEPNLDIHILFYADGSGQTVIVSEDDLDGNEIAWEVSELTGSLIFDGDELANFAFENDTRWVANTDEGRLSCDIRNSIPLDALLVTSATGTDLDNAWTCNEEIAIAFGFDKTGAIIEGNDNDPFTWETFNLGSSYDIVLTAIDESDEAEINNVVMQNPGSFTGTVGDLALSCTR